MEIILNNEIHTTIHIRNKKIKDKILNFINELELFDNEYIDIEDVEHNEKYSLILNYNKNLNQDIIKCNKNTTSIIFNCDIIEPIDLTNFLNLKKIVNLRNINLIKLPDNLEEIKFSDGFNSPINNLPPNLKTLTFNLYSTFSQPLDNLPISLEKISLGNDFYNSLDYLPDSLNILELSKLDNINLDNLPISVNEISIQKLTLSNVTKLPSNLKILKINKFFKSKYDNIIFFPQKLQKLFVPKFNIIDYIIDLKLEINIEELYFTNYFEIYEIMSFSQCSSRFFSNLYKIINNKNLFSNLKKIFIYYSNENLNKSFFEDCYNFKGKYFNTKSNYENENYFIIEF